MTSFPDGFDRADSTNLGPNWVQVSGGWAIVSDQLAPGATGATIVLRAATAMATSDHFAQITIAVTTSVSQGVWCRGDATLTSGYMLRNDGTSWGLFKIVSGVFTSIGTFAAAAASGDVARVQAVGSTITGWVNGVIRITVTDTAVTSGTSTGLRSVSTTLLRYDNFLASDVVTGATLGIASAVETAQALTGGKAAALGTASEVGTAQPLTGTKAAGLAGAAAVEAAQPLTGLVTAALGTAVATETALPLTGLVTAALGTAVAAETALPLIGHVLPGASITGTAGAGLTTGPSAAAGSTSQACAGAGIGSSANATGGSSP